MKSKVLIFVGLIVVVSITLLTVSVGLNNANNKKVDEDNQTLNYKVYYSNDYLYVNPSDLYNNSSLVIIGEYVESLNSYMRNDGRAYTNENFKVEKVLKGEYSSNNIVISRIGGTITLEQYLKSQTDAQIKKKGLSDLTKTQLKNAKVTFVSDDYELNLKKKSKYLLIVNYDVKNNQYIASAGEYSILQYKSNTNEIYNISNNKYEKLTFIK